MGKKNRGRSGDKKKEALTALKAGPDARVSKDNNAKPIAKKMKKGNKDARMSLATGQTANSERDRKTAQDARTLYVRFKDTCPENEDAINKIATGIRFIRVPRQGKRKAQDLIRYCFIEFGSEKECESAKSNMGKNSEKYYVDFVGSKSKNAAAKSSEAVKGGARSRPINPCRLFINGIGKGVNNETLKQLFPQCKDALIPKHRKDKKTQGSHFGFVEFHTPADAKSAFDAAQDLNFDGHHITVLYARLEKKNKKKKNKKEETNVSENKENADESEKSRKNKRKKEESEEDTVPAKKGKLEKQSEKILEKMKDEESSSEEESDDENEAEKSKENSEEEEVVGEEESEDEQQVENDEESDEDEEEESDDEEKTKKNGVEEEVEEESEDEEQEQKDKEEEESDDEEEDNKSDDEEEVEEESDDEKQDQKDNDDQDSGEEEEEEGEDSDEQVENDESEDDSDDE